jgi:hypothetical protein
VDIVTICSRPRNWLWVELDAAVALGFSIGKVILALIEILARAVA